MGNEKNSTPQSQVFYKWCHLMMSEHPPINVTKNTWDATPLSTLSTCEVPRVLSRPRHMTLKLVIVITRIYKNVSI